MRIDRRTLAFASPKTAMNSSNPGGEERRLASLRHYQILDTAGEELFDDLARLAAQICGTPIALVSLVDRHRQWFKARIGLTATETPREISFCTHAIRESGLLLVSDALNDPRFAENPLVTDDPKIRFYAGAPLVDPSGYALGTLCVIDRVPRELSEQQQEALAILARQVMAQMELRLQSMRLHERLTEQRLAERALSQEVDRLVNQSTLIDLAHEAIMVRGLDGEIAFWNRGAETLYGWSRREVVGKTLHELLQTRFPDSQERLEAELKETGRWEGELVHRARDGREVVVQSRWTLRRDMAGRPAAVLEINSDITERKRAREAARLAEEVAQQEREQLRRIVERVPVAIAILDRELRYLTCSQRWGMDYGLDPKAIIGLRVGEANPVLQEGWLETLQRALAGEYLSSQEDPISLQDGTFHYLRWAVHPWHEPGGRVGGLVIVTDWIDELVHARENALAASTAKSEFLASMSHEIRTPMNAIIGMADLLEETLLDQAQQEYVRILKGAGETLLALINDVLDLSKVESGQLEVERVEFDLAEVVDRAAEVTAPQAHEKGLELICAIDAEVPSRLVGDPHRLRQVLLNLLGNAIKFTAAGEVLLRVRREREGSPGEEQEVLSISVRDTGIGVPPEKLESIFQSFTQADSSTTRRYGGSGLGLTIARRLVQGMGGRIWVESEVGHGSTFHLTVPLVATEGAGSRPDESAPASLNGRRALIVDDNRTNRLILRETLSGWGCVTEEAASGPEALAAIRRVREHGTGYDVVLLDCHMPEMDGFAVAEAIRREPGTCGTPVMMLTSGNRGGDLARARQVGLNAYLIKPVKRADLLAAVQAALKQERRSSSARPQPAAPPAVVRSGRILLVEDSPDNRALILAYLRATPHQLDIAENGEEAVQAFRSEPYDLVLMDMQMPVKDGYTATREIRQWEREHGRTGTPILALTANAFQEDADRSLAAGCTAHLIKPIKKTTLLTAIGSYLEESTDE